MAKRSGLNTRLTAYGWIVCGLAALFYCYEYLLRIEPSVMVPQLMHYFGITAEGLGILSAMYYYAYTPLQAVVGLLTDYFGPKWILTIAIGLCVIGVLLFGSSDNIYLASLGRFLIGAGSAFAFVGALKMAAIWLPKKRFALFVGLTMSLGMIGAMVGDVELSYAVQYFNWQRVVIVSALFGAFLIPIFILFVHSKKPTAQQSTIKLVNFREGFFHLFHLLKQPVILLTGLIGGVLYLSLSILGEMWGIPFVKRLLASTPIISATVNSAIFLGWLIGSPLNGWISDKIQSRRIPITVGCFGSAILFSAILLWPTSNGYLLFFLFFLFGLLTSVEVLCFAIARDFYAIKFTGIAVAMINLLIMLTGAILQPFVAWLLNQVWSGNIVNEIRFYTLNDYRKAMIVIPVTLVIAGLLSSRLKETYR